MAVCSELVTRENNSSSRVSSRAVGCLVSARCVRTHSIYGHSQIQGRVEFPDQAFAFATMERCLCLAALLASAAAHGSMIMPLARNSIDATLAAW